MDQPEDTAPYAAEARAILDRLDTEEQVGLTSLSMLDLCALGAPAQVMFDTEVARLWFRGDQAQRDKASVNVLAGLEERGLLVATTDSVLEEGLRQYRYHPTLGLIIAARSRPSFVVACDVDARPPVRTPNFYALGDRTNPLRGVVVEWPEPAPAEYARSLGRLGPLGRLYRYILVTRMKAARILAEWAIQPAPKPKIGRTPPRTISVFRHDAGHDALGLRLAVRGDGAQARLVADPVDGVELPDACDQQELAELVYLVLGMWRP